jgi:predicted enzyme related to lactoylglutathione lyase
MSKHAFCHVEWAVTDLERAKKFYGGMFNWKFEGWGDSYLMFSTPSDELGGGFMKEAEVKAGSSPTAYVLVDDVESYLEKATSLGGKVCMPKTEIPEMGWFGIVQDPDGNTVGLYQSGQEGGRLPKHAICHIEYSVTDGERAKSFLGDLFEWKFEAFGESYHVFMTPSEDVGGGLMQEKSISPAQSPMIYIHVEEIEPYLEKATRLGGKSVVPKTEIPGIGWFGVLVDHDGNSYGVYKSKPKE